MRRLIFVATTALLLAVPLSAAAPADGAGGANNVVMATNTVDGSTVARDRVQIAYDPADTVANSNIATAQSTDCVACRTVAVALQVVLVEGDPSDFEPANAAVATNGGCDTCQTYAFAFQDIIQPGQVVYLSGDAQQELSSLRDQVDGITNDTTLSYDDMKAQLESVFAQIVATVSQDIQAAGGNGAGDVREAAQVA